MTGLLLDTNVVSALRAPHRQPEPFQHWLRDTDLLRCHVSSLTWMEIRMGVLKKKRTDPEQGAILEAWFTTIHAQLGTHTLSYDSDCATVTAPLWLLRSRGSVDTLIAGTALAYGLTLVTRNLSDFHDLPGLMVVNPWDHARLE